MLHGWTKVSILNWVLKVIFYFTVFFAKKQRNFPLGKYRPNELFKSSQALIFFLIPFPNLGLNVFPCWGRRGGGGEGGGDNVLVSSQYFTHLRLPILKLILHSHNRIFRLCKSLETTYTFSNKNKLTFLTAKKTWKINHISGRISHEKITAVNTAVQSGSYIICYIKKYSKILKVCSTYVNTIEAR